MNEAVSLAASRSNTDEQAQVSIVIPLYNEEAIIDQNLARLGDFFDSVVGAGNWLFILVDNGSLDKTPVKVQEAVARWPLSRVVNLAKPNYGAALRAGLTAVTTRWAYLVDIEQWDLPFLAWSWDKRESCDVFLASKRSDPTLNFQTPYRRLLSCGLNGVLQMFFGFSGTDTHGPKLIDCHSLEAIIRASSLDRGHFDTEVVLRAIRAQKRIIEVPVVYQENRKQRNMMVKKIVWNLLALRRLVRVMKDVPYEGMIRYKRLCREDILSEVEGPLWSPDRPRA